MAGIRKKGDASYCTFRFQGRHHSFAVGNVTEAQALAKGAEVDETLALIECGRPPRRTEAVMLLRWADLAPAGGPLLGPFAVRAAAFEVPHPHLLRLYPRADMVES